MHAALMIIVADGHYRVELNAVVEVNDIAATGTHFNVAAILVEKTNIIVQQIWSWILRFFIVHVHKRWQAKEEQNQEQVKRLHTFQIKNQATENC